MIAEKSSLLTRLRWLRSDQLNTIARMPQGSTFNDSYGWADNCAAAFPFRFHVFLASNVLQLNHSVLSFFLEAFRSTADATPTATSAQSAGHTHTSAGHNHSSAAHTHQNTPSVGGPGAFTLSNGSGLQVASGPAGGWATDSTTPGSGGSTTPGATGAQSAGHTHTVDPTLIAGIYEGTVATNVMVKVNGVDRTVALGGPAGGFTSSQQELALDVAWLTLGAWNTIELTPSNLGRVVAHLRLTGWVQSA